MITSRIMAALDKARRLYGLAPRAGVAIHLFGFAFFATFAILLSQRDTYWAMFLVNQENGPVENASFLVFLAASVVGLITWWRSARRETRLVSGFYLAFAIVAFVAAMEEISWGQSYLNYTTPFGLRDINEQGEFNIHNMPVIMELNPALLFIFGAVCLIGVWLGRRPSTARIGVPTILLPLIWLITLSGLFSTWVYFFATSRALDMVVSTMSEVIEFEMAYVTLLYAVLNRRMLRRHPARVRRPEPSPERPPRAGTARPLVVGLAALALNLVLAAAYPLIDPDEGRNAEVAREMAVSGDLVVPHLAGMPYLDKPPGLFWAGALGDPGVRPDAVRRARAGSARRGADPRAGRARRGRRHDDAYALTAVVLLATAPLHAVLSAYVIFDLLLGLCVRSCGSASRPSSSTAFLRGGGS